MHIISPTSWSCGGGLLHYCMHTTTTEGGLIHKQMYITTPKKVAGGGAIHTCVMPVTTSNDLTLGGGNMHSLLQKATPDSWSLGVLQCRSLFFSWRIITPTPDLAISSYNAIWHPQPIIYTTPTNRQLTTPWGCYNAKLMKGKKQDGHPHNCALGVVLRWV